MINGNRSLKKNYPSTTRLHKQTLYLSDCPPQLTVSHLPLSRWHESWWRLALIASSVFLVSYSKQWPNAFFTSLLLAHVFLSLKGSWLVPSVVGLFQHLQVTEDVTERLWSSIALHMERPAERLCCEVLSWRSVRSRLCRQYAVVVLHLSTFFTCLYFT